MEKHGVYVLKYKLLALVNLILPSEFKKNVGRGIEINYMTMGYRKKVLANKMMTTSTP